MGIGDRPQSGEPQPGVGASARMSLSCLSSRYTRLEQDVLDDEFPRCEAPGTAPVARMPEL